MIEQVLYWASISFDLLIEENVFETSPVGVLRLRVCAAQLTKCLAMQWQVLKETTYFILTDETDMFFRPLERLSKVETPSPPPGNIHKENKKMFITQP